MTKRSGWAMPLRCEVDGHGRVLARHPDRSSGLNAMRRAAVAARGDGTALVFEDRRWTWSELDEAAARLAGGLRGAGVAASDRVALLAENHADWVLIALAVAHVGAVFVPLSAREQRPGVAHMLTDSGAVLLLYQRKLEGVVPAEEAGRPACICIDDGCFDAMRSAEPVAAIPDDEDAVAAILYTSGTTGRAKGVPLTHGAIVHSAMNLVGTMELGSEDRSVVAVPLSHVTGLVALFATILQAQATLIVMPAFSARSFLAIAERERMTHTVMVPAMYNLCLLQEDFGGRDLTSWRVAGFGGAPMALSTIEHLRRASPGLRLMNLYGATETASPAVIMPPEQAASHPSHVGRAAPGCEIVLMDFDGREVPQNAIGELWIRGAGVTRGYWGIGATPTDFCDGFWRSGDMGAIDADGFISIRGRSKEVINRGGYKIYPAEVEDALMGVEGVIEAAVVARSCDVLGERVHAVVVMRDAHPLDLAAELQAAMAVQFSDYKVPETWDIRHDPLPRNANGKVQKQAIRAELTPYRRP